MDDQPAGPARRGGSTTGPDLTVTRTGVRHAGATNARGASVRIGPEDAPGVFSPGELLQVALAACEALSADHRISHALGPDAEVVTRVRRTKDEAENRYTDLHVEMSLDLASLAPGKEKHLRERIALAVQRQCTVGRSIEAGVRTELTITDLGVS